MNKKDFPAFIKFLKSKKIRMKGEQVHVKDLEKAHSLIHDFEIAQAKKLGLPKLLAPHANSVVRIEITDMERAGQTPEDFDVELVDSWKNYDEGTWSGDFKGTVANIFKYVLEQCQEQDLKDIEIRLLEAAEEEME